VRKLIHFILLFQSYQAYSHEKIIIAMGSCNKQERSMDYFHQVNKIDPNIWLWLGDNIYADHMSYDQKKAAYNKVKRHPGYQKLISKADVYGIWDDHDYAFNNADRTYQYKEQSKQLFFKFMGYQQNSPLLSREGIYKKINLPHNQLNIELYLLDTRSFYHQKDKEILGPKQWIWFEKNIEQSSADLILIASGIAVLSNFNISTVGLEGWSFFKQERKRLFNLVSRTPAKILFLSGDRHSSEFSKRKLSSGKEVYEFMASGLNRSSSTPVPNKFRWGKRVTKENFGTLEIDQDIDGETKVKMAIHSSKNASVLRTESI
jgi:alkaline phosphatase D